MTRTFVVDTSVLLAAPDALTAFDEHTVILPLVVIKELEAKRNDPLVGYQARSVLRTLETLSSSTPDSDLKVGVVRNEQGGTLRVEVNHIDQSGLPEPLAIDRTHDTRILAVAANLKKEDASLDVTVVSRDLPMRLLAETLGIRSEDYRRDQIRPEQIFTGLVTVDVTDSVVDALFDDRPVAFDELNLTDPTPNLGIIARTPSGKSALAVIDPNKDVSVVRDSDTFGLRPRSAEQRIALHHLLAREVGVVSLGGSAGTGKSVLTIAAGLEQVMEHKAYRKVVVFRPLHPVGGQDLGFLPGTVEEKMHEHSRAIFDALEAITTRAVVDEILDRGLLEVLPVTHIRGRTLTETFVLIDEAQNLEHHTLLSVLSRAGEGTKIVLAWDAAQRDNLRVGPWDGVATIVERLKGEPLFAHTTLVKSERSAVAEMATRLLTPPAA